MVSVTSLFLVFGLAFHFSSAQKVHREKQKTLFVKGNLGKVSMGNGQSLLPEDVKVAATPALMDLLVKYANATGEEDVRPTDDEVFVDGVTKNRHIRFQQYVGGLPLQRASLMLHARGDTVFAFNGEFTPGHRIRTGMNLGCEEAMSVALAQFNGGAGVPKPVSTCMAAAVRGDDGIAHKGYEREFSFGEASSVVLYASGQTGALVAVNRVASFARNVTTKDFRSNGNLSWVISTSSDAINTGVDRFDGAHNFTVLTYDFYKDYYNRDSIDGKGLRLVINVDYAPLGPFTTDMAAYNPVMKQVFVAPEGAFYYSLATSLDIVAHEWTHGFTAHTSKLGCCQEPGALNEGMSDIFAMAIGRFKGNQSIEDALQGGEGVERPGAPRFAINFRDPRPDGILDYYPFIVVEPPNAPGSYVHENSGMMSLAFVLMTEGGRHPRNKTNIVVAPMDPDFDTSMKAALDVFYWSNMACLTPNSGYMMIRRCTEMFAKSANQTKTIRDAWAAVGVGCFQAAAQCSSTAQCCGALVCRKRTLTQTAPACANCAKPLELCFNNADCCSPTYYKCLPSAAGSTRKVCKRG